MALIYHYCDTNAFMSIIQNDALWLSSLYSMNDSAEIEYVRKVAKPVIGKVISDNISDQMYLALFNINIDALNYYAACFSTESDDLYQWQAYGQRGKGFAIGFDSELLCEHKPPTIQFPEEISDLSAILRTAVPGQSLGISRVQYLNSKQIESCIQNIARSMLEGIKANPDEEHTAIIEAIFKITSLCTLVKNSKFKAENEYRLLYAADITHDGKETYIMGDLKDRKWRNGPHGITPYFEYKGIKKSIKRIVTGPNCAERNGPHMNDFLLSNGIPIDILSNSDATLR